MTVALPLLAPSSLRAGAGSPQTTWLVTFADLVLLLLTFFVLVFVMSRPVEPRYVPVAQSYLDIFNPAASVDTAPGKPLSFTRAQEPVGDDLIYLRSVLEAGFAKSPQLQNIQFRATSRYLILSPVNMPMFQPGTAALTPDAAEMAFALAGVLGNLANPVAVIGGADRETGPAQTWTLGLTRADAMAGALANAGYVGPLTVLSRAEPSGQIEFVILAEGTRR